MFQKIFSGHTFYTGNPQPHAPIGATLDLAAIGTAWAAFIGFLPDVAAVLSLVYLTLQILVSWWNYRKNK